MQIVRMQAASLEEVLADSGWSMFLKLPFGEHGRAYYRAVAGDTLQDRTFGLQAQGRVVALVECDVAEGVLGCFGFPVEPRIRRELPFAERRQVAADIIAEMRRIAAASNVATIRLRCASENDPDGLLLGAAVQAGARASHELRAVADLAQGDDELLADLRTAHRQSVRWAGKNMQMAYVDRGSPDRSLFENYRSLHAEVAGRATRRAESWDEMHRAIAAGQGDLVIGSWNGQMVSGTLVLDGFDTAYYASGAYRRDLFDKPLSHGPLFAAMGRARARGRRYFDVGDLPAKDSGATDKELAIGHFKRGFSSRTLSSIILAWKPQET